MNREAEARYRNNPKYWDRYAFANSVDPDQMLQNATSDQGTVCHTYSNILDTSMGSRMGCFIFSNISSKELSVPILRVNRV